MPVKDADRRKMLGLLLGASFGVSELLQSAAAAAHPKGPSHGPHGPGGNSPTPRGPGGNAPAPHGPPKSGPAPAGDDDQADVDDAKADEQAKSGHAQLQKDLQDDDADAIEADKDLKEAEADDLEAKNDINQEAKDGDLDLGKLSDEAILAFRKRMHLRNERATERATKSAARQKRASDRVRRQRERLARRKEWIQRIMDAIKARTERRNRRNRPRG